MRFLCADEKRALLFEKYRIYYKKFIWKSDDEKK